MPWKEVHSDSSEMQSEPQGRTQQVGKMTSAAAKQDLGWVLRMTCRVGGADGAYMTMHGGKHASYNTPAYVYNMHALNT